MAEREAAAERLEAEIADACGMLNAATGRLVALLAQGIETKVWEVAGVHSARRWVAWQCGVSAGPGPVAGALGRSHARGGGDHPPRPGVHRHRGGELARSAGVTQLRRVLLKYSFEDDGRAA